MKSFFLPLLFWSAPFFLVGETATLFRAKKIQVTPSLFYQPGEILVERGKIQAVGNSVKIPKGCKIVEWTDSEIYPGLISPGSSLGLAEINALRPTRDLSEVGTHTPAIEAWAAVNPDSELIPVARANGITHSLTVPMGGMISGTSGLLQLYGWGIEEMIIKKQIALHLWWPGHGLSDPSSKSGKCIQAQINCRAG
jgi:imidazolonepropionase-like amidohydrolase